VFIIPAPTGVALRKGPSCRKPEVIGELRYHIGVYPGNVHRTDSREGYHLEERMPVILRRLH